MKVRALIVEDEFLARETLREFAADIEWLEFIGEAADGATAVRLIDELRPQLIFLDVQMPFLSGLRLLELIKHQPFVVFTTAFDDYAISAFELGAVDYLLKPFGRKRFIKSLERVKRHFLADNEVAGGSLSAGERIEASLKKNEHELLERFFVRDSRGRAVPVSVENILRLTAADDYVEIHTFDKSFLINMTLNDFERRLNPKIFRRVHRSHIVNLNHIKSIENYDRRVLLRISDGAEIIASREGTKTLKDVLY